MTKLWAWMVGGCLLGGCSSAAPEDVDLTGTWRGTVNSLGIASMTLDLVDEDSDLRGTGEWTPVEGGASLGVSALGLHFGIDINLLFRFTTAAGTTEYTTQGRVQTENRFHLVFPSDGTPTRVDFQRQ
jgi:hypothetical protein